MKEQTKQYNFILEDGSIVTHELTDEQRAIFYRKTVGHNCVTGVCDRCPFFRADDTSCIEIKGFTTGRVLDIIEVQQYDDEVEL